MDRDQGRRLREAIAEGDMNDALRILSEMEQDRSAIAQLRREDAGQSGANEALLERLREQAARLSCNSTSVIGPALPAPASRARPSTLIPFTVMVLDAQGKPLMGAVVRAQPSVASLGAGVDVKRTDKNGQARFEWPINAGAEEYAIVIRPPVKAPKRQRKESKRATAAQEA